MMNEKADWCYSADDAEQRVFKECAKQFLQLCAKHRLSIKFSY